MHSDYFYAGLPEQLELVPVQQKENSDEIGIKFLPKASSGEGYLWSCPINDYCSIIRYHLRFYKDMKYSYIHPEMHVVSLSTPAISKAVLAKNCMQKRQLLGYFLSAGIHEYTLLPGALLDNISISFKPEFYKERLPALYKYDFSRIPQIISQIDGTVFIPTAVKVLSEIACHPTKEKNSILFYEAKVLELISGLLEWGSNSSHIPNTKHISASDKKAINKLNLFLKEHYCDKFTVEYLAKMCQMSQSKLFELFRSVYGITITEFVIDLRIKEAKKLLKNSSYTNKEIAPLVGYSHQSSFAHVFKQKTTMSPQEYREMNR